MYTKAVNLIIELKKTAKYYIGKEDRNDNDWYAFEKAFIASVYIIETSLFDSECLMLIGQAYILRKLQEDRDNLSIYTRDMTLDLDQLFKSFKAKKRVGKKS